MLEREITALIQEFRTAIYGKDVRKTYADIAELVCIKAMRELDHAVEQGNYAEEQGDYAKEQGDYAKTQGEIAGIQTNASLQAMLKIQEEFEDIIDTINSTENGALLLEINQLLKDMYHIATDDDIDKIIAGIYVDEDNEGSIFESGTMQDIDDIINGTYSDDEETEE